MKRFVFSLLALLLSAAGASAQLKFVDAEQLGLVNKLGPTENRYHRVDTDKYDLTQAEANRCACRPVWRWCFAPIRRRSPCGRTISITAWSAIVRRGFPRPGTTSTSARTADGCTPGRTLRRMRTRSWCLSAIWTNSEKECLLYLPLFSELGRIEIGIDEGARIEASANPFRHRIIIFGSSFTHGTSTGRPGMSYPMIMQRNTGLQFISLGVSGNSKLQQSFAQIIGDNACDAIVVDAFSNPGPEMIRERFLPFVAAIRKALPPFR